MTRAANVSDLFRPTDRSRSPIVWDQGLSALANAIRAGSNFHSRPPAPVPEAGSGTRSDPPQPRVAMSAVNLDEAKADEVTVFSGLIDISPAETLECC